MTRHVESFTEHRPASWHPGIIDLGRANVDDKYASWFRKDYRATSVSLARLADCVKTCAWAPIVWKNGKCLGVDFIYSGWMTLDFDETTYTVADALRDWVDTVHIIGTTKSHQVQKKGKPAKDRFRIIVPWSEPITDAATYSYNVELLIRRYNADETCSDAARFFWPCRTIVHVEDSGYLQPVQPFARPERLQVDQAQLAELRRDIFGKDLPQWIARFVRKGELPRSPKLMGSRKWACNAAARQLKSLGWKATEIANLLHDGKFDRANFEAFEIDAAVKSAFSSRSR